MVFPTPDIALVLCSSDLSILFRLTNLLIIPHIRLHTNPIVRMLLQERQPYLNRLRVSILDLNKSSKSPPLKILLRFLGNEVGPGNRPPLNNSWQRNRSTRWEP